MTENPSFEQLPTEVSKLSKKLDNIERLLIEKNEPLTTDQQDKLLNIQEASELLHLTVPTLYSKVSRGELPVMKRTKRLYFSREDLMEYIRAGRKKTNIEIETEAHEYLIKRSEKGGQK